MEQNKFTVSHCYVGISNIKETEANILKTCILGKYDIANIAQFAGYGTITFENKRGDEWLLNINDKFIRGKINCIVFDICEDEKNNPYNYTKLAVFQSSSKALDSYGYVWIKDDGNSLLRICLDHMVDAVVKHLAQDLNQWKTHHIFEAYNSKKKLNAVEYENIYKKYIETYRCYSYDEWKDSLRKYNQRYKIA